MDGIATKITEALSDESFREQLKRHSHVRAKQFSWKTSAQKAIAFFERKMELMHQNGHMNTPVDASVRQIADSLPSYEAFLDLLPGY